MNKPVIPVACVDIYDGTPGPAGTDGIIGVDGAQGEVGPQGPPGADGTSATVTQEITLAVLDDPTDGATIWTQQGATEADTAAKSGTRDRLGNAKQYIDGNGTVTHQCIASDTSVGFRLLSSTGVTLFSILCNGTQLFKGTVTIQ